MSNIKNDPECVVMEPTGLPIIQEGHVLPEDVNLFYSIAGGRSLFPQRDYGCFVLPPQEVKLVGNQILGEQVMETLEPADIEPISTLYTLFGDGNGDYFSVDFGLQRLGYCYDTFHETFGGDCPMIAKSFTELLARMYANKGEYWYWLKDDFVSLGNAYDKL
jgi:antitoxin YokJ